PVCDAKATEAPDLVKIPSRHSGVILLIGTEIKEGEKVPADQLITAEVDGQAKKYRQLKVGDKIEKGQLLARLDDRLARLQLAVKEAKVQAARADLELAEKTAREAKQRWEREIQLREKGGASTEDVMLTKLIYEKAVAEVKSKKAAIGVA